MKSTSSQKIKIGLFSLLGLAALFMVVYFIGSQKGAFNATYSVHGTFSNVNGLVEGNNVRFAGINVGVVKSIEIVSDSAVLVTLKLNSKVKKFIKKDSRIAIGSDGLMGDKLVTIGPGGIKSHEQAEDGTALATVNPVDGDKIMTKMSKVSDNAERITNSLAQMFDKVNKGKGTLGRLLNSDQLADNLQNTIKSANKAVGSVHKTSATLNEDLKAAQHNFLLRGYFKKKKQQKAADSLKRIKN
ncbi:MlaD family protein [Pedobacter sp. L105]|uniref:MlaD family protein n=1 Tax=Pedobacter sp. L105 TaxID=1641871 RepID=UPI00131D4E16|nr:MlaD family protein [Pedobacter sp. L105]